MWPCGLSPGVVSPSPTPTKLCENVYLFLTFKLVLLINVFHLAVDIQLCVHKHEQELSFYTIGIYTFIHINIYPLVLVLGKYALWDKLKKKT